MVASAPVIRPGSKVLWNGDLGPLVTTDETPHAGPMPMWRRTALLAGVTAAVDGAALRPRLMRWGATDEEVVESYPGGELVPGGAGEPSRVALRGGGCVLGALALAGGLAMVSYPCWRTWCLTWGASDQEAAQPLPGDDLLEGADLVSTRAVSIDAASHDVWPWLAQMGPGRGGLYTYDWIENLFGLHMHSADVILPQFQNVEVGSAQRLGKSGPVLRVAVVRQNNALVLRSDDGNWVWAFCLVPDGNTIRLVSRNRISTAGASKPSRMLFKYVMEPGSLIMERKMLLGIKQRAEQLAFTSPRGSAYHDARWVPTGAQRSNGETTHDPCARRQ
jgi:hypothetical protein